MKGLKFFTRTSSSRLFNIAAYHSPHSLTWSWVLSFSFERQVRPLWYGYRTNGGYHCGLRIPLVGVFMWQKQRPMWYRDLYQRKRDEADGLA